MGDAAARGDAGEVGLIENIQPGRSVVVVVERHARPVIGRGPGNVVLISTVVISGDRAIANREAAGVLLDTGGSDIDIRTDVAVGDIAEKSRRRKIGGTTAV